MALQFQDYLNQQQKAASGVATNTRPGISQQFQSLTDAQIAAQQAATASGVAEQQRTIEQAGQQFDPLRTQAFESQAQSLRAGRERLANLGQSAFGGYSQTRETRTEQALQGRLGQINLVNRKL